MPYVDQRRSTFLKTLPDQPICRLKMCLWSHLEFKRHNSEEGRELEQKWGGKPIPINWVESYPGERESCVLAMLLKWSCFSSCLLLSCDMDIGSHFFYSFSEFCFFSLLPGTPNEETWPGILSNEEFRAYNYPKYRSEALINHAPRWVSACSSDVVAFDGWRAAIVIS